MGPKQIPGMAGKPIKNGLERPLVKAQGFSVLGRAPRGDARFSYFIFTRLALRQVA
jgi:hypothetical protein